MTATMAAPVSNGARLQFAIDTLTAAGAPVTLDNIVFMLAWFQGENAAGSRIDPWGYNPANISHPVPGHPASAGTIPSSNGPPVQNYGSWSEGVQALAASLHERFALPILAAMQQGKRAEDIAAVAQQTGWAAGGYGGGLPSIVAQVRKSPTQYANGAISGGGRVPATVPVGEPVPKVDLTAFHTGQAIDASFLGGLGNALGGGLGGILTGNPFGAFSWVFNPNNWRRMLFGTLGVIAMAIGLYMITVDLAPGVADTVKGAAKDATMAAAVA